MGNMLCNTDVAPHVAQHIPMCMAGFSLTNMKTDYNGSLMTVKAEAADTLPPPK